jgi:putative nucleotidyltransferase with HDIG domain
MFKRIRTEQLTVGMYLQEFCSSWMESPFWRPCFFITEAKEIEVIMASSVREVWIDYTKGLDVADSAAAVTQVESGSGIEAVLTQVANVPTPIPVSAAVEAQWAAKICEQSKQAMMFMFKEARMGNTINEDGAKQLVEDITASIARNPSALISLARLKTADNYTYMHSVAVCAMMVALARQLGLDEAQTRSLGLAGLMHDLGKAVMPMDVLNKPGKLSPAEFNIIKSHPVEGHKILLNSSTLDPIVLDVCLHHHEKTDGSGYPKGLKGNEISLYAKMAAVCDVYDAITSDRPYKQGWGPAESLRKMAEWADGHFDTKVFQAFVKSMGIYPVGSLVRLTSGRIGVVLEQTGKSLTMPSVKVFFSTKSNLRIVPYVIDLSRSGTSEKIVSSENPAQWNFPDLNELWSGLHAIDR